uniref:dynein axonemal assembly factor 6-like isoform X4 n=1 Tax=Myxine glutinosa TaxID=7769 RepID=UPI00358EAA3B
MSMSDLVSIQALETLLAPNSDDLTDDVSQPSPGTATLTPAHIIPMKKQQSRDSVMKPSNEKAIWNEEEVREEMEFDDVGDDRKKPDYEILFKQRVGTEDLFLCLNRKDVSTACCEDMLQARTSPSPQGAKQGWQGPPAARWRDTASDTAHATFLGPCLCILLFTFCKST